MVQLIQASKHYQRGQVEVAALRGVDLEIQKGEFISIMGPSGSGKTTLLHLIGGLDGVSSGSICVSGKDLSQLSEKDLARYRLTSVGYVFQDFNLMPTLSAVENVALPLMLANWSRHKALEKAASLFDFLGLEARKDHTPNQLSGGEMQRVSVARALIADPPVLLADEPTGNLDSVAGEEILSLLRKLANEREQTIIMVTHDAKAAAYADRIVTLKDGCIRGHSPVRLDSVKRVPS